MRYTPYVTYLLIAANILCFFIQDSIERSSGRNATAGFMLTPLAPHWYQFFTYQFMHGGLMHIAGNMLFLYVFGCNIEDRLGHVGFLAFYLAGGVVAGMGHSAVDYAPVIGASGSVAAVTGIFLALLPKTRITILFIFFFIAFYEIPSMYLILLSFGWDLFSQFGLGAGGVAYLAHISGNVFGFLIGMALLWTRILPREPYDFMALIDRWNRRRVMRDMTNKGYSPWEGDPTGTAPVQLAKPISEEEQKLMQARHAVSQAIENRNLDSALSAYEQLLLIDTEQTLHRQAQLDVANHAMHAGRHRTATTAYERFLETYPNDSFANEVRLILGLAYLRYLQDNAKARTYLEQAIEKLDDPNRQNLAKQLLAEAGG